MTKTTFLTIFGLSIALVGGASAAQLAFQVNNTMTAQQAQQVVNNSTIFNSLNRQAQAVFQSAARATTGKITLTAQQKNILEASISTLTAAQRNTLASTFKIGSTNIDTKDVRGSIGGASPVAGVTGPSLKTITADTKTAAPKAKETIGGSNETAAIGKAKTAPVVATISKETSLANIREMQQEGIIDAATAEADTKRVLTDADYAVGKCDGKWSKTQLRNLDNVRRGTHDIAHSNGKALSRSALIASFQANMNLNLEEATAKANDLCNGPCAGNVGLGAACAL